MKVYNTLTKQKEDFKPSNPVRIYSCGPTVYNYVHIGNLRTFIFEDLLRRYLLYKGYTLNQVKNITDVDDKTIRDSQKEGISLKDFTDKYTASFFEDIDQLHIQRAEQYPKATDHVHEMAAMVSMLLEKGLAYKTEDGIYFSITKFADYGKLAHIKPDQLKAGASGRVKTDEYDKENAADFALWKFYDEKDGEVFWDVDIGKGRPGWHIECSAMSMKHLTKAFENETIKPKKFETIDIHTGGVDLVFPHHQDEIAQTEGCVGKPFVKYWMHSEHLLVDGKKMSKSLGNFYTLRDLVAKGYNPLALRYLLLSTHYRQKLNFTFESLEGATTAVQRINDFILRLEEVDSKKSIIDVQPLIAEAQQQFEKALDNDLEISPALAAVFDFMTVVNTHLDESKINTADAQSILEFMQKLDTVLSILTEQEPLPPELQKLVDERIHARKIKNWSRSDELRDELKKHDIAVEDTPHGQRWKRILS